MAECLARVYQMVKRDKLKAMDQDAYRKAIMRAVAQYLVKGDGNPNDLSLVPKYFLLNERQIVEPEPRGPLTAATHIVAQFYGRGGEAIARGQCGQAQIGCIEETRDFGLLRHKVGTATLQKAKTPTRTFV